GGRSPPPTPPTTPTFPTIHPTNRAQSTNGTTAIPITDTVSSRHTGPAGSNTSTPTTNVVIGFWARFSVESRTGPPSSRPTARYTMKTMPTMTHTHRNWGTMGRPHSRPPVIHGTKALDVT